MLNVFVKKSSEKLYVELSNGRMMPLEDLVRDYERLLKRETPKTTVMSEAEDDEAIVETLEVGKWFRIDRNVIDENMDKIRRKCIEDGDDGKQLFKRLKAANKIANQNPHQYPRIMEVLVFKNEFEHKTEQQMRDECEQVGDGMCDEIICALELLMRICNGEPVDDLVLTVDRLPYRRVIKLRNGGTGLWGGSEDCEFDDPPATLRREKFNPDSSYNSCVPYAFRAALSEH